MAVATKLGANLVEIIYASAAKRLLDDQQLAVILKQARENNQRLGVTGILLYDRGSFLQILEGPEVLVIPLFEKIARDDRHDRVAVLRRTAIAKRSFEAWTMGFVSLEAGLRQQLVARHTLRGNGSLSEEAADLVATLDEFRDGRWRQYIAGY